MPPASRNPKDRAAIKLARRHHETQLKAAVLFCNAVPGRRPADAVASGRFPLVDNARNLAYAIRQRRPDGTPLKRSDDDFLTEAEEDILIERYKSAGYSGECPWPAEKLLSDGARELLLARASSEYTKVERDFVNRNGMASRAWCETMAWLTRLLLEVCPSAQPNLLLTCCPNASL